jgi:hypothetical protein
MSVTIGLRQLGDKAHTIVEWREDLLVEYKCRSEPVFQLEVYPSQHTAEAKQMYEERIWIRLTTTSELTNAGRSHPVANCSILPVFV